MDKPSTLAPEARPAASPFDGYQPPGGFFDEYLDEAGQPRKPWAAIADGLREIGAAGLAARQEQQRRIIEENGVTYNVYGGPGAGDRPWPIELLPTVLSHGEWSWLEGALAQRLTLLNALLADLYGEQRLLTGGHLPYYPVLANPAFLRPCAGEAGPGGEGDPYVHLYAADLARSPDGHWWVLNDRVEAPSGMGYALENRIAARRVLPDLFRAARVQHLRPFTGRLIDSIAALAPRPEGNPRVVLLTPGPANETYFEHAYLARYLGCDLVEGFDLTVRDNRVFLKTVEGLRPVDVIVRRVDSAFCDPLELRDDSLLGVPGLLNAIRQGSVALANRLGAGLLETPALPAFLPGLCQTVQGEELKIPSVATWWCGGAAERRYVLDHLDELVIKPTFRGSNLEAVFGPGLDAARRRRLRDQILAHPERYCAQEMVAQATTPVFDGQRVEPRHFFLRVFLAPRPGGGGYHMMPGGFSRTAPAGDPNAISMQQGGCSQDTWVLSPPHAPAAPELPPRPSGSVTVRRGGSDLPSRAADNLFWLGRYAERTEMMTRQLRLVLNALIESGGADEERFLPAVLPFLATLLPPPPEESDPAADTAGDAAPAPLDFAAATRELQPLLWDRDNPFSLASNLATLHRIAFTVKERLSQDCWGYIGRLRSFPPPGSDAGSAILRDSTHTHLNEILSLLHGFGGVTMENMTRGAAWHYLDLGRRIERAVKLADLIQICLDHAWPGADETALLLNLLTCTDCVITYRRRYLTDTQVVPVIDLLLLEPANPRGLIFQANQTCAHIAALPQPNRVHPGSGRSLARVAGDLRATFDAVDLDALANLEQEAGSLPRRPSLEGFLDDLTAQFRDLSDLVSQVYFAHTPS